ncbi:Uncharacterized protein TCM_013219 [Theobroma cacao]|uniref:Uncharacterized protein n=1 Tax=Theobroma cacao TaxID=3641 RepID=A0A061FWS3_THECC|nr:Uncharacterized protein TCM_013219 [Theobroma cacao]
MRIRDVSMIDESMDYDSIIAQNGPYLLQQDVSSSFLKLPTPFSCQKKKKEKRERKKKSLVLVIQAKKAKIGLIGEKLVTFKLINPWVHEGPKWKRKTVSLTLVLKPTVS